LPKNLLILDRIQPLNGGLKVIICHSPEIDDCLFMVIAELHYAIFIAIKRPVVTGKNWSLCRTLHNGQEQTVATGSSRPGAGSQPASLCNRFLEESSHSSADSN